MNYTYSTSEGIIIYDTNPFFALAGLYNSPEAQTLLTTWKELGKEEDIPGATRNVQLYLWQTNEANNK